MIIARTNWNLYQTFVVVYETRNMHTASEILCVSRSAVGQKIKDLGDQLGVVLFTPHRKGVEPTGEATQIYPQIKQAVDLIMGAETGIEKFTPQSTGIVKVATSSSLVGLYISDYLKEFCSDYPNVQLEFFDREGIDLLAERRIDLVLDLYALLQNHDFRSVDLFNINGIFVASKEFLKKRNLSINMTKEQFLRLPIIAQSESWHALKREFGIDTDPFVIKTATTDMTVSLVKNSIGVGYYCRELLEKSGDGDLVALNISGISFPRVKIVCAYNKPLAKPAKAFIDGLIKFCGQ